jgi:hypothetical protein
MLRVGLRPPAPHRGPPLYKLILKRACGAVLKQSLQRCDVRFYFYENVAIIIMALYCSQGRYPTETEIRTQSPSFKFG